MNNNWIELIQRSWGTFTNKPLCLDPRFLGRFSGFISIAEKTSAQKFFLVAAIYEHSVGGLVKTLYLLNLILQNALMRHFNAVKLVDRQSQMQNIS